MEQLRIDLVPMGVTPNAHASQYDVGRVIRFLLYNGGTVYTLAGTETITVKMAKPDGTEETVSVTNTSSDYVDFVTTDGLLNQAGLYPCEISITSGTDVIGSKNFNLRVELDPYDGHNIRTVTVGPADICTFTTDLPEFLPSVLVNVLATGGNGTPSTPVPINGYSSANITRCGVNLLEKAFEYRPDVSSTLANCFFIKKGTYCFSFEGVTGATSWRTSIYEKDIDGNDLSDTDHNPNSDTGYVWSTNKWLLSATTRNTSFVLTFTEDCFIRILFEAGDTVSATTFSNPQLELGNLRTTYHAYNGQTFTIAFGQTVYGGVLDVTRGKLHVTHILKKVSDISWTYRTISGVTGYIFLSNDITGAKAGQSPTMASCYAIKTNRNYIDGDGQVAISNNTTALDIVVKDDTYTSADDFVQNRDNETFVFELATPFDIDLTPEVISAVVGTNNVFADCGETEVEYLDEE